MDPEIVIVIVSGVTTAALYWLTHRKKKPVIEKKPKKEEPKEQQTVSGNQRRYFYLDINGLYHNPNGPALTICFTGPRQVPAKERSRVGCDAIQYTKLEEWYCHGQLHREDGPACEYANGYKKWYRNGVRHREDGPAVEYLDGEKYWYQKGKLHREDGPAVRCFMDGNVFEEFWENGTLVRAMVEE